MLQSLGLGKEASILQVAQIVSSLSMGYGGPARSAAALSEALADLNCRVTLWAADMTSVCGPRVPVDRRRVTVRETPCLAWPRLRLFLPRRLLACLTEALRDSDVAHSHELWQVLNHVAAEAAWRARVPHVISTRGAVGGWALRRSAWKKNLARRLYVERNIRRSACLHALTPREAQDLRGFGVARPIAVIPNGVWLPEETEHLDDSPAVEELKPELAGKRIVLFMGRLHPTKGLPLLLGAWSAVHQKFPEWHLVLAGPDEGRHAQDLRKMLRGAPSAGSVTFTGPVQGGRKRALFGAAGLFCLPSLTEGFSVAVLEALAWQCPVLITDRCNFDRVAEVQAGRVVPATAEGMRRGLTDLLSAGPDQLAAMGRRGYELVRHNYTWRSVAERMRRLYLWLVGGGHAPEFVLQP